MSRVSVMPEVGPLGVNTGGGGPLAHAQAGVLIGAEETPEFDVVVARQAFEPAPEIAPQHSHAADQHGVSREAVDSHRQVVERRGAHEVLPEPDTKSPGPDARLAGALRAEVDEAD